MSRVKTGVAGNRAYVERFGMCKYESIEKSWCNYGFNTKESRAGYVLHHIDESIRFEDPMRYAMFLSEDVVPMANGAHTKYHSRNRSEETREKLSKNVKGEKNPRYGKPGTFLGKKHTEETKRILSEKAKTRPPISEETRRKLSEATSGEKNPMYGRKQSPESKAKASASLSKRLKGVPHSKEHTEKVAATLRGRKIYNNGREERHFFPDSVPDGYSLGRLRKEA